MGWYNYIDGLSALFDKGGYTLWAILFASILLWILVAERYLAHWKQLPAFRESLKRDYIEGRKQDSLDHRRIKALSGDLRAEAEKNTGTLIALNTILPLLGLLGTVSGMIKVFDVITVFGTGNTRGMAAGISEALVTTMAGLFTALPGIYFVSNLQQRADDMARRFEAELTGDN